MKIKLPNIDRFNKIKPSTTLVLTVILILILLYQAYLVYQYIYLNLVFNTDQIEPSNIVRVNLDSYQDTIRYMDNQKDFSASSLNLQRSNPFRP